MRLLTFIEVAAIVAGIVGIVAGQFFALAKGVHLGIFLIGAGIALGGVESLATRRMGFRPADDSWEAYGGVPALVVGLMALLVGAAVIGAAYALENRNWAATLQHLAQRPAPVLAAAGMLLAGAGVLMMLNPKGRRGLAWRLLVYVPRVCLGLACVVAGVSGVALAAWEWRAPAAYDRFVIQLERQFDGWLDRRPPSGKGPR